MTSSGWSEVALGDVADVSWGNTSTTKKAYVETGFRAYSASGPDGFVDWAEHHEPGVVLSAIGAQCGKTWWAEGSWTCIKNTIWFRSRSSGVDSRFLFYATSNPSIWPRRGAAQPFISQGDARALKLRIPSLSVQRAVVGVLSAIDDLIENNRRRIEILEEMARLIYQEWFVHFRFPGHEDVELVDSELGPIPEGWEVTTLGDISSCINRGIAPKYDEDSPSLVINQRCIRDHRVSMEVARGHNKKVPEDKFVRLGDVLINSTGVGTLGRVAPVRVELEDTTVDSHVTIVRPQADVDMNYFAELVLSLEPLFESMGVGSTGQTELSRARVGESQIVAAPRKMRHAFGDLVKPMTQLSVSLRHQSRVLAEARELLLPRLISGDLDVSHLDLNLEPVA